MIASGYPPYLFSENLCNGKLAMALMEQGIQIDAISRVDEGPSYGAEWLAPWNILEPTTYIIKYDTKNKFQQLVDVLYSGTKMGGKYIPGIRWVRRAYETALDLMSSNHYDAVLTRSPNDMAHLVGYMLKKRTGCRWIANWNDPADPIWPGQYKHEYTESKQRKKMAYTANLLISADVNTFPSDTLRNHFIEWFPVLKEQRTEVLPHIGLIQSAWPKGETNPHDGKIRFLHSGNLSAERDPETMFQALRRLVDEGDNQFEFHIMGHVNDYADDLIKKYNLEKYVKFIGSFPYLKALEKMQAYDVLVLLEAKLDKGIFFASKFTDYLQTGLPILAISPIIGFAVDKLTGKKGEYLADNQSVDDIYLSFKRIFTDFGANMKIDNASLELYKEVSPDRVVQCMKSLVK